MTPAEQAREDAKKGAQEERKQEILNGVDPDSAAAKDPKPFEGAGMPGEKPEIFMCEGTVYWGMKSGCIDFQPMPDGAKWGIKLVDWSTRFFAAPNPWMTQEQLAIRAPEIGPFVFSSYKAKEFPFVTTIPDDGKDEGGGWQVAKTNLDFWDVDIPHLPRKWLCPVTVQVPLRTRAEGVISPSLAAKRAARIANLTARDMDYKLPQGIFCKKFAIAMDALFKKKYRSLGASVTNP